jgi:hypothetical protein
MYYSGSVVHALAMTNHHFRACHFNDGQFEFYLRFSITKSNESTRAPTAFDVATSDEAEEKMLGH